MRLLVVSQHYKPEPFNVHETCEELVRRGHAVTVLTALPNCPVGKVLGEYRRGARRDEIVEGVRVRRVPIVARGENLRGLNKLRRVANYLSFPFASWLTGACLDEKYDAVMCFQFSPVLMALPALRIAHREGIPCLLWSFDLWPEDMLTGGMSRDGAPYRVMRDVSRRIYGEADLLAVTSPGFETYFSEQLGLRDVSPIWLPQFAESIFEDVGARPHAIKDTDETIFTFAGNVGGNQAVETIVKAAVLVPENTKVKIRIVGSGSRLDACRGLALRIGAHSVEFLGRRPLEEMPGLYEESDAMLLTLSKPKEGSLVSRYTIPRKFQSYIATGTPVISAVEGTVSDIVRESGCGLTCLPDDPAGLADAMTSFATMPKSKRDEMADRARSLYLSNYSRERYFDSLEMLLCRMTGDSERTAGK